MWSHIKQWFNARQRTETVSVSVANDTVFVTTDEIIDQFLFDDVVEIVGYKRDRLTTDQVRLIFRTRAFEYDLSEDMVGWSGLVTQMERHFQGLYPSWFQSVSYPAFATNWLVIWRRDKVKD